MDNRKMKFILIGASTVGKTALLLRIADGKFHPDTITTIGIEFKKRTEQI
jgi:GTPase SAR1 family protein